MRIASNKKKQRKIFALLIFVAVFSILLILFCIYFFPFFNHKAINEHTELGAYNAYQFYSRAILLVPSDADEALSLCLKTEKLQDECIKRIAGIVSTNSLEKGFSICNFINDSYSKSDCFFVISKYVSPYNISLASEICKKPELLKEECYYDLGFFIAHSFGNDSDIITVCDGVPLCYRAGCFVGFCRSLSHRFNGDIDAATALYNKVPPEFRPWCSLGFGEFLSEHFLDDISSVVSSCSKIAADSRASCFSGFGFFIGLSLGGGDISRVISACNKIPIEFRENCFEGLGKFALFRFIKDIDSTISICNKTPFEFRDECFFGMGRFIGIKSPDINSAIYACSKVPSEFKKDCFSGYGKYVYIHSGCDASYDISACYSVPIDFRSACFNGFGQMLGQRFINNHSFASSICDNLDSPYSNDCRRGVDKTLKHF